MVVAGKKVLVFGTGISGIGAVKLLEDHGAQIVLFDGNVKADVDKIRETIIMAMEGIQIQPVIV